MGSSYVSLVELEDGDQLSCLKAKCRLHVDLLREKGVYEYTRAKWLISLVRFFPIGPYGPSTDDSQWQRTASDAKR